MSTSYYRLSEPFTSLRVDVGPSHTKISLWTNHAMAGHLVLRNDEAKQVVRCFYQHENDNVCPLRTHWGGKERGAVVTVNDPSVSDEATVISEYGEILTVAEVKARDGKKRKDGWPTELFGYDLPNGQANER